MLWSPCPAAKCLHSRALPIVSCMFCVCVVSRCVNRQGRRWTRTCSRPWTVHWMTSWRIQLILQSPRPLCEHRAGPDSAWGCWMFLPEVLVDELGSWVHKKFPPFICRPVVSFFRLSRLGGSCFEAEESKHDTFDTSYSFHHRGRCHNTEEWMQQFGFVCRWNQKFLGAKRQNQVSMAWELWLCLTYQTEQSLGGLCDDHTWPTPHSKGWKDHEGPTWRIPGGNSAQVISIHLNSLFRICLECRDV